MRSSDLRWINGAVQQIKRGITRRMDKPDGRITVYKAKNCIRIDIKNVNEEGRICKGQQ